mgnify:CR=1 FL=1
MKTINIAVREMVEYLFMSGDLSSDLFQNVSAIEGTRAHQYVQRQYQGSDDAEVPISFQFMKNGFDITLSGRMDGVLTIDGEIVIHEIKSTRKNTESETFEARSEHLAQLKIYCYLVAKQKDLSEIWGRLSYVQLSDYRLTHIDEIFSVMDLEKFFTDAIECYLEWVIKLTEHHQEKMASLSETVFPFDQYRRGQREMMRAVYQTMNDHEILYAVAPTGIGKTMAALFSSLKAIKTPFQKIFYLTAKTEGKKVAIESMAYLHEGTLKTKTLELTAKDSICFLEKRECDPSVCPFAKGFFDRLKDATTDIFDHEVLMTRDVIERYARKHVICPFEYSLFVSYFVDVIVCDYNYAFDPRAHLIRYFDQETYQPMLLIDEAHNMITRSREMYSASVKRADLIQLRRVGSKLKPSIRNAVNKVISHMNTYDDQLNQSPFFSAPVYDEQILETLINVLRKVDRALKENSDYPKKSDVFEVYFKIVEFQKMAERFTDTYRFHAKKIEDDIEFSLRCLDASAFITDTIERHAYGCVFFSATLQPINYYQTLLTKGKGETMVIQSPFDQNRLKLMIDPLISTRYQDRKESVNHVITRIHDVLNTKKGNYIVFFPSYQYLNMVKDNLVDVDCDIITQERDMEIKVRQRVMERFKTRVDRSLLGMFVMGGMFSEGIDYLGDMLNGVIIIGVGLPMISDENEELKSYYEKTFRKGFQFAYQYPGMNKVIQSVGRVIRSHQDYGFALLIDDRFMTPSYKRLFPKEWRHVDRLTHRRDLKQILEKFYQSLDT